MHRMRRTGPAVAEDDGDHLGPGGGGRFCVDEVDLEAFDVCQVVVEALCTVRRGGGRGHEGLWAPVHIVLAVFPVKVVEPGPAQGVEPLCINALGRRQGAADRRQRGGDTVVPDEGVHARDAMGQCDAEGADDVRVCARGQERDEEQEQSAGMERIHGGQWVEGRGGERGGI